MDHADHAHEILDTLLGYLGFVTEITVKRSSKEISLQVATGEPKPLIGHRGERLDDIQYLVNRLLQTRAQDAPRVAVDIDNYRATQEFRMIEDAEKLAERVISTGKPMKLPPMNSFHRRVIHSHFKENPKISTWSPSDNARLKQITISQKDSNL